MGMWVDRVKLVGEVKYSPNHLLQEGLALSFLDLILKMTTQQWQKWKKASGWVRALSEGLCFNYSSAAEAQASYQVGLNAWFFLSFNHLFYEWGFFPVLHVRVWTELSMWITSNIPDARAQSRVASQVTDGPDRPSTASLQCCLWGWFGNCTFLQSLSKQRGSAARDSGCTRSSDASAAQPAAPAVSTSKLSEVI